MEVVNHQINKEIKHSFDNNYNNVISVKTLLLSNFVKTKMHHYCWHILHAFSVNYPIYPTDCENIATKLFLKNINNYFSYCSSCSNFKIKHFFENYDIDLFIVNRENLILFFIKFHSFINTSLNKMHDENTYTIDL